ncbi:Membrane transport protein [Vibrio aerogenes CECT 7868]|uniref:Membrane transport protein n=1 Tax=Vibrio aerogenes CECT 7868 TaxID=1216006 RepID=A0A1M6EC11_9VIBR|nr:AEC family transporter [Vibrio aerogenes]SHI83015.1 Membrane transport protein [Vibrio aerogenes CECT 7868]
MSEQVVGILFPMFAIALVGYIVGRWIKTDFRPVNRLNMDVFAPALVFSSLATMPLGTAQLPLLGAAAIAVLLPGLLMLPVCYLFRLNYQTWAPSTMFRNSGNLAIPLFTYTFGQTAMAPAVLLFVFSSCAQVSIGLAMLSKGNPLKVMLRMPVFLASVLALMMNLCHLPVWKPLLDATSLLGQPAVPVMLLSLGAQMCHIRLDGLKTGVLCTLLSLLTGAICFTVIHLFIPLPAMQLQMMVLFTMLPPAVMNYLFAERFNTEPQKVASMVLFSNFFTVFTLPLLLTFALSVIS